jgi:hypothetical protein
LALHGLVREPRWFILVFGRSLIIPAAQFTGAAPMPAGRFICEFYEI